MERKLYRSTENEMIGGVCGGLGEYFGVDPTIVRLVAVLLLLWVVGFFAYIISWIIIPRRPPEAVSEDKSNYQSPKGKYLAGLTLIAFGIILLLRVYWYWFDWEWFWALLLIVVGVAMLLTGHNRQRQKTWQGRVNGQDVNIQSENGGMKS